MHKKNRGGVYPQAETVRNLGLKLLGAGFNESETNHEGAGVKEIPFSERAKHGRSGGLPYEPCADYNLEHFCERAKHGRSGCSPYETYEAYNIRQCGHIFLERCFCVISVIMYGTMPHSHLLSP